VISSGIISAGAMVGRARSGGWKFCSAYAVTHYRQRGSQHHDETAVGTPPCPPALILLQGCWELGFAIKWTFAEERSHRLIQPAHAIDNNSIAADLAGEGDALSPL